VSSVEGKASDALSFPRQSALDTRPAPAAARRHPAKGRAARRQEQLLEQIALGAQQCREVERQLSSCPAPELETIIKLHRVLILKFSAEAKAAPEMLKLVKDLMKPVMDWARLEEKRKDRELARQQHREAPRDNALSAETLEKIEREMNLL
jgi:hypothetical protein